MSKQPYEKITPENYMSTVSDERAVSQLASAVKEKLRTKRDKGFAGWNFVSTTDKELSAQLLHHVIKSDPIDVAAYCAFLHARGSQIKLVEGGIYETLLAVFMEASTLCQTIGSTPERQQSFDRLRKLTTLA